MPARKSVDELKDRKGGNIINLSFGQNEGPLIECLDQLVKDDCATSRSAWLKDQIRIKYRELKDR